MSTIILIVITVALVAAVGGFAYWRRRPRDLKSDYFSGQWQELQAMLKDKQNWPGAVAAADKLLDQALKKKHIAGKSMGERLVKAQRILTDNDGVWFGHKLRGQLDQDPTKKLKEGDVKDALLGIRQALKDLGALPEPKAKPAPKPAVTPAPKPEPNAKKLARGKK